MRRRDEGSALILVLGAMTVLSLLVSVTLSYAMRTSDTAVHSTSWNQAFAAAEAGVDDYLARLNRDDLYWRTIDCTNVAMRKPNTGASPPCGWGTTAKVGWLSVPGSDTSAEFHYDVDVTSTPVNGTIALTSTGRSNGVTRSIQVTLRRGGFGEFLYYTVYETKDPADYADPVTQMDRCAHYYWEPTSSTSKPRDTSNCTDITFIGGDTINGPLHSNDAILITDKDGAGPAFHGTVTTSWPQCKPINGVPRAANKCYRASGTVHPTFDKGIGYRSEIELPTSIGDLRQYVDPVKTPSPGCLYTGPTRIVFLPTVGSATPTMKVWSNWSKTALNPGCGNAAASWPQTVAVPQNKLIMVQNVPSTQSTPASGPCGSGSNGAIGDGLPVANDYNNALGEANCRYGSVYVEGTLKGRVTITADNNIVVTDDLTYAGGQNGTDALGLIASNSVQIYHPVSTTCSRTQNGTCVERNDLNGPKGTLNKDPQVQASILTLQHSFEVQAHEFGNPLGYIHLFGTIAQRFRGIVGQGGSTGTGFLKDYNYDSRLRYAPPPYFLDPVRSSWGQKTFGEISPRYGG